MIRKNLLISATIALVAVDLINPHSSGSIDERIDLSNIETSVDSNTEAQSEVATMDEFLNKIGFMESSNDYTKVNTMGYLGKYQFGKSTLETLGYGDICEEDFINSPKLQERVMLKNLRFNRKVLSQYIEEYEGKCINNVIITESGILAAAHLAGPGNVKKFINTEHNPTDAYGTQLSDYLIKFSHYQLKL